MVYLQTICVQPVLYYIYEKHFMNKCCKSKIYKQILESDSEFKPDFDSKEAL